MTEELSIVNFVLGIIGTITGIGALIIHLLRLRKENPRIKVKVLSCEHDFEPKRNQLSFWTKFQIRNLGDRGTSLNDMDLVFISDNKRHLLKKQYFRGPVEASERKWINPRETMDLEVDFWEEYRGEVEEKINCTFSIYHTQGKETTTTVSQKRKVTVVEI